MKCAYDQSGIYAIRVVGRVDISWSDRLGGMTITYHEEEGLDNQIATMLHGRLPDQAALLGVLNSLYNARYPLLFVRYLREG